MSLSSSCPDLELSDRSNAWRDDVMLLDLELSYRSDVPVIDAMLLLVLIGLESDSTHSSSLRPPFPEADLSLPELLHDAQTVGLGGITRKSISPAADFRFGPPPKISG
ncbi:uncharacterized protein PITG_01264 [Phytophthora infestans T30-4]|uniref:Uncharacterized protein n=1 Tax=Phytophthora infestans (strain T30-4) TaxID=403677 RepID=D0MV24_PHYIT|nr:uncharacterized protein PITG_01264 [Phytophthora infestans T30-4]EEY61020.1 hypothetical protein PITG_01264 [Phytophthora infestans T30-4]|eukprot:XP_002907937.1 hypothetical protein PITG_01264 [Phytophthora infestans T30-4]